MMAFHYNNPIYNFYGGYQNYKWRFILTTTLKWRYDYHILKINEENEMKFKLTNTGEQICGRMTYYVDAILEADDVPDVIEDSGDVFDHLNTCDLNRAKLKCKKELDKLTQKRNNELMRFRDLFRYNEWLSLEGKPPTDTIMGKRVTFKSESEIYEHYMMLRKQLIKQTNKQTRN